MNTEIYILIFVYIFFLLSAIWLLVTSKKRKERKVLKNKILGNRDLNYLDTAKNITMSISKSEALYKDLIAKVHPDKFQNKGNKRANELAARITASRRSYDELCKLEIEVVEFLEFGGGD